MQSYQRIYNLLLGTRYISLFRSPQSMTTWEKFSSPVQLRQVCVCQLKRNITGKISRGVSHDATAALHYRFRGTTGVNASEISDVGCRITFSLLP